MFAEATKLLKGVSLKPLQVPSEGVLSGFGIDRGWLMSAVANASDPLYAPVDSGATNALRPADPIEVAESQVIRVDLASGGTQLHINKHGTLLSEAACQVIIPAGYLVQLGFSIVWGKKGCTIRRKGRIPLEVTVVKGCPLIDREIGLQLLREYEQLREPGLGVSVKSVGLDGGATVPRSRLRSWLAFQVATGSLSRVNQLVWLRSMFPDVPIGVLNQVAGDDALPGTLDPEGTPWNHRRRRSILKAKPGEVLTHLFAGQQKWRVPGILVEVEKARGSDLLAKNVWQHLLVWACSGVVGGVIGGPLCRTWGWRSTSCEGSGRWGLPGLPGNLAGLVTEDNILWVLVPVRSGPSGSGWSPKSQ